MCITKKRKGTKVVYIISTPYGYEATFDNNDMDTLVDEYNKLYNSYKSVCKYSDDLTKQYHNTKNKYIKENERLTKEINYLSNKDTFIMQHFIRPNGSKFSTNSVEGLMNEIEYCYGVIERYSKELSKMEEKYEDRCERLESLRKENEELKKENEAATDSNNICLNRIKELQEELSEFKRPNSINEFKKTSTYINRLEAEMRILGQNVVECEEEVEVLESENKYLKKELADVKDTLAFARNNLDIVRNENSELEKENKKLKKENKILKENNEDLKSRQELTYLVRDYFGGEEK